MLNRFSLPLAGIVLFLGTPVAVAQQSQSTPAENVNRSAPGPTSQGPHGGTLRQSGSILTETIVQATGLHVYLYSRDGQPLAAERARGVAKVSVDGNPKRYRYNLVPDPRGLLKADVNLSSIAGRQITVDYHLLGIPSVQTGQIVFRDVALVPVDPAQADAAAIARQRLCPVSNKPLGSMGEPVGVKLGDKKLFVCCAGCVEPLKQDPAQFLKQRPGVQVVQLEAGDAEQIARQAVCPVMEESLGSMGKPIKLLVGGKPIFLCCKGCIKKVQAAPEKYLAAVYQPSAEPFVPKGTETVRPGVYKVTAADKPFVAAQKICPVMDEPLDAMGGPFKVDANGKAIYICCPGCAKRIAAGPDKYLKMLTDQGIQAPNIR